MILHRRIHRFERGRFQDGLGLVCELNRVAKEELGKEASVYYPGMVGSSLSRRHVVVDTIHEDLAAMEAYYERFLALPTVQPLLERWGQIEEESWAENFLVVESDGIRS